MVSGKMKIKKNIHYCYIVILSVVTSFRLQEDLKKVFFQTSSKTKQKF